MTFTSTENVCRSKMRCAPPSCLRPVPTPKYHKVGLFFRGNLAEKMTEGPLVGSLQTAVTISDSWPSIAHDRSIETRIGDYAKCGVMLALPVLAPECYWVYCCCIGKVYDLRSSRVAYQLLGFSLCPVLIWSHRGRSVWLGFLAALGFI